MARYWVTDNLSPRTSAGVEFADHHSNVHILLQEELSPVIWPGQLGWADTVRVTGGVVGGGEGKNRFGEKSRKLQKLML